jgi:hypothetical protein
MGSGYPAMGMIWVGFARTLGIDWVGVPLAWVEAGLGYSLAWVGVTVGSHRPWVGVVLAVPNGCSDNQLKGNQRKKKRLHRARVLKTSDTENIIGQREAKTLVERERCQNKAQSGVTRQSLAHGKRCREVGHNLYTCQKDAIDSL